MKHAPIRIGVLGLGRAFTLMLPTFLQDPRVQLVAACDPLPEARQRFAQDFGAATYSSAQALCADPQVELVYVATPHALHAEHVCLAAAHGKHALVEKPMAITLAECDAMVAAAQRAGTRVVVGHSHSFNTPVLRAAQLLQSGAWGAVRMLHAMNYTDFLYRARRPEELDTARGGGVVFSQAAHQVDVVRLLAGTPVRSVRAHTGNWDAARATEGAYSALLQFASGAFASLTYSGYAHFDSDALLDWHGELGQRKNPGDYGAARKRLAASSPEQEAAAKAARNYGGAAYQPPTLSSPSAHQHFGHLLVGCERGDLRVMHDRIECYGHDALHTEWLAAPTVPRQEVVGELWATLREGLAPVHDGAWARATLAVCLAMLESARSGTDIMVTNP